MSGNPPSHPSPRVPYKAKQLHMHGRTVKDPYPSFEVPATRFLHGYDLYNI